MLISQLFIRMNSRKEKKKEGKVQCMNQSVSHFKHMNARHFLDEPIDIQWTISETFHWKCQRHLAADYFRDNSSVILTQWCFSNLPTLSILSSFASFLSFSFLFFLLINSFTSTYQTLLCREVFLELEFRIYLSILAVWCLLWLILTAIVCISPKESALYIAHQEKMPVHLLLNVKGY